MNIILKKIKTIFSNMDKPLLFVTIFLFLFGLFNIVTASSREAINNDANLYYYFYKHIGMLGIGLFLSIFIVLIDTKNYKKWVPLIFLLIVGILIYLLLYGAYHRGAQNWIEIFGVRFQPSEFAKPVIIIFLAILFEKFYKRLRTKNINHFNIIAIILFIGVSIPVIIFVQKDFGTMMILMSIFGFMFLASPILRIEKLKTIGILFAAGLLFIVMIVVRTGSFFTDEQRSRFNFFNPCTNYEDGGYQVCNAFIAINNGGLTGLGIGKSKQKYSYINDPHTDSIFSIFVEEWGLITAFIIFICYALVLGRILTISSRASTIRGKYMALGIAIYIFMHILFNLGGLFGLIPLTGVPLPFLSYGGSFTICLMCSIAVAQRINIETRLENAINNESI
ncbi:MAG: FtsW/RodA/SpoVE family cell cycle protein [Bacilli bacterium]|nr:FtsW/RodA/SpoVE family cell cycle protein [Bacilli bacterium]